jgi:outer membrane protein OmpA-like peptidoglycan-associated protein/Tol biopolymer transport system component
MNIQPRNNLGLNIVFYCKFMKNTLTILGLLISVFAAAQPGKPEYTIKDKKAIKTYEEALTDYEMREYTSAATKLEKLYSEHPEFVEAGFLLAQIYGETNQLEKSIPPLTSALKQNPKFYPEGWLMLAECHFSLGHYKEAENAVSSYIRFPNTNETWTRRANLILSSCIFAQMAIESPVPFEPVNLGTNVNTTNDEYYPGLTVDEKTLLFTRCIPESSVREGKQEDFFIAENSSGQFQNVQALTAVNTIQNEGAPTLSSDGQLLIFTACEGEDGTWGGERQGVGSCDLFYAMKNGGTWTSGINLGEGVNTGAWESQPSLSGDGRTLYFVHGNRTAQGIKQQDIYVTELKDNGQWTRPIPIIGEVNSKGEEESVMIHPDGKTLYFSSNGHIGMGGLDLYVSHLMPDDTWGKPINLGYPINTFRNENSILVAANGKLALMASDRAGGQGGLDLYSFELHTKARPDAVTYVSGVVSDAFSYKKLEARFELIDLSNDKVVAKSTSNPKTGEFFVCIPSGREYALNVSKDGYLFYSDHFSLVDYKSLDPFHLNIELQKLKAGASIVLNNVFFDSNSYALKPESKTELNKLANMLKNNPVFTVEISGHTDNVGDDAANLLLSENRAKSVVAYLVAAGVEPVKLMAKGYGESVPVDTNDTDAGRAHNRRTEFKVL